VAARVLKRAFRKNGAGTPSADASKAYRWYLAIPLGRGRHVTLFPLGVLLVCVAISSLPQSWQP
jgi:hypothetical protein